MPSLTALDAGRMSSSTNSSSARGGMKRLNASTDRKTTAIPYVRVDRTSGKRGTANKVILVI